MPLGIRNCRRDGRVTAEGHLGDRAEIAHVELFAAPWHEERRLGIPDIRSNAEHVGLARPGGIQDNTGRVSTRGIGAERRVAQDLHDH